MDDHNTSVTSSIDEIGGGRSNKTSDKVADHVVRTIDKQEYAKRFVKTVEKAVDRLPNIEKQLISLRYMTKDHEYINDYTIYEIRMDPPISAPYYDKVRQRAFSRLFLMLGKLV